MPILDNYKAVITAEDRTAPGVKAAQRTIGDGLKKTGVAASGAEADKAAGAWGRLNKSLAGVPANLKVLYHTGGLGKAVDQLKEGRRAVDAMGNSLRNFVPATAALAALGTGAGLGEALRNYARYGQALKITSAPLGASAQDLSRWEDAARRAGLPAGSAAQGFGNANDKILSAAFGTDANAVALFNYFGIAARNADGSLRTVKQLIPDVFRVFKDNAGDPRIQHNILAAFGLGNLDPLFRQAKNLSDLMATLDEQKPLSQEQIERADRLSKSFGNLEQSTSKFAYAVASSLEPAVKPLLDDMAKWLDANRQNEKALGAVKLGAELAAGAVGVTLASGIAKLTVAMAGMVAESLPFTAALAIAGLGGWLGANKTTSDATPFWMRFGLGMSGPVGSLLSAGMNFGSRLFGNKIPAWWPKTSAAGGGYGGQTGLGRGASSNEAQVFAASGLSAAAQRFMADIASGEAHSFNTLAGGGRFSGYGGFPQWAGYQHMYRGRMVTSHGAGLFQDEPRTWAAIQRGTGISDFSPVSQVRGNWWWAQKVYRDATGRNLETDLVAHNLDPRGQAALAGQWGRGGVATGYGPRFADFGAESPAAPASDFAAAAAAHADTHHLVEIHFRDAPSGLRSELRMAQGPADLSLRVEQAMAPH